MKIRFVKMHGCGNDYVYIDAINQPEVAAMIRDAAWPDLVRRMSDRHAGIGGDGVIAICVPTPNAAKEGARVRMRMFNADASEGEMCGNGVRCVAKFAHDRLGITARTMGVETGRGVLSITYSTAHGKLTAAVVNMGEPVGELERIPVNRSALVGAPKPYEWGVVVEGTITPIVPVSMGNPHAVTFVDDVESIDLARLGPLVERHAAFPNLVNFHIVQTTGAPNAAGYYDGLRMRTWERGSGLTQACGTGACAVHFAATRVGRLSGGFGIRTPIHVPGGTLRVGVPFYAERGPYTLELEGPAEDVFEGEWVVE